MADRHTRINRRSWLKTTAGFAGLATFGIGTSAAADDDEYELVEVEAGGNHSVRLEDGDALENVLIDITATGASFSIRGVGNDWAIRNVGVRGVDDRNSSEFIVHGVDEGHEAVIENLYIADGNAAARQGQGRSVGIFVHPDHAGTLRMENVNVQHWSDNGVYASAPGNPGAHTNSGKGGVVEIVDSYAANNHVSGFRLGTKGSFCENCVMANNQRGFWAYYETTELRDCDLLDNANDINVGSYSGKGQRAEVVVADTSFSSVTGSNAPAGVRGQSAGEAEHEIPDGVPTSAEEAARGAGSDAETSESGGESSESEADLSESDSGEPFSALPAPF